MSIHMDDAARNAQNDLVVLVALAEALETKIEDMNLAADRSSPRALGEDQLVTLAYAIVNHSRSAHKSVVARIAKHDGEKAE